MRLILFIFYLTPILSFQNTIKSIINSYVKPSNILCYNKNNYNIEPNEEKLFVSKPTFKKNKIRNYAKLMRIENVFPTFLLTSIGGIIINPSFNLLYSKTFWMASFIAQLVMVSSMIINDIFDIDIDKINNPTRPLANGSICVTQALILCLSMFFLSSYLSYFFLSEKTNLPEIQNIVVLLLLLYTPIFKRIILIKNVLCASIVSGSIYFSGIATTIGMTPNIESINLLLSTTKLFFGASLCMEILLDISDYDGDKKNNINTIPVLLGKDFSLFLSNFVFSYGIVNIIVETYKISVFIPITFIFYSFPIFNSIMKCKQNNYSKNSIKNVTKKTTGFLLLSIMSIFYCAVNI